MNIESLIESLKKNNKTISIMESCTGGALSSEITNHSGSSNVFKFGIVTYSNEAKIMMGVNKEIIDTYTVYSKEVAECMAKAVSKFSFSNYGIGITGQLEESMSGKRVYISIYDESNDIYKTFEIQIQDNVPRRESKTTVVNKVINELNNFIK